MKVSTLNLNFTSEEFWNHWKILWIFYAYASHWNLK